MKYELVLFDFDDTLLSFKKCEQGAFRFALENIDQDHRVDEIFPVYSRENQLLWDKFEQGLVTTDFLRVERFRKTFEHFSIDADPNKMSQLYMDKMPELIFFEPNALEVCQFLSEKMKVGIITNGIAEVQKKKYKKSGLDKLIHYSFISEECGYAKPDSRFFDIVMKGIDGIEKEKILVVGDRLETDIKGANDSNIDSCWYNSSKTKKTSHIIPKYEISNLEHLKEILF